MRMRNKRRTDWSEAYLKQLAYVASLHPKAMVLREKDLTEEKYEELAKVVIRSVRKGGDDPYFAPFSRGGTAFGI